MAEEVLSWDQLTKMPPAAAEVRASQIETIAKIAHERFSNGTVGRLLQECGGLETAMPSDSFEASLVRVTRRDWERQRRVPTELAGRIAQAQAEGYAIWIEARRDSDFGKFLPALQRNIDLRMEYIDCFEPTESPYDVLIDDFEHGLTASDIKPIFDRLKPEVTRMTRIVVENASMVDDAPIRGHFPKASQEALCDTIAGALGAMPEKWRIDETAHPFQTSFGTSDIRLATRYDESFVSTSLYGTIHEFGHGLYEAQVDERLNRTPLGAGCSMTLHESQSRLWENLVGRSRAFLSFAYPTIRLAFPEALGTVTDDAFYKAVNKMKPSFIRVEADELTYGLHIILRFELELDLIEGRLKAADLPEVWNAKVKEYLGLDVPSDARGVLQDVHWSAGHFGYFPEYLLGSVLSVQIWDKVARDQPDLDEQIAAGEFAPLQNWLKEHIHRFGRTFTPKEMIERAVGGPLDPEPYLRYLTAKVNHLYGGPAA
jgi:carboxypeptidase Taq